MVLAAGSGTDAVGAAEFSWHHHDIGLSCIALRRQEQDLDPLAGVTTS